MAYLVLLLYATFPQGGDQEVHAMNRTAEEAYENFVGMDVAAGLHLADLWRGQDHLQCAHAALSSRYQQDDYSMAKLPHQFQLLGSSLVQLVVPLYPN
jgi:hypothetical protein